MVVTIGQMKYETEHLLNKLKKRSEDRFNQLYLLNEFKPHPMFQIIEGGIEKWEIV